MKQRIILIMGAIHIFLLVSFQKVYAQTNMIFELKEETSRSFNISGIQKITFSINSLSTYDNVDTVTTVGNSSGGRH